MNEHDDGCDCEMCQRDADLDAMDDEDGPAECDGSYCQSDEWVPA